MQRKDTDLIAQAIARARQTPADRVECSQAECHAYALALREVTYELEHALLGENPRFDYMRFRIAALGDGRMPTSGSPAPTKKGLAP